MGFSFRSMFQTASDQAIGREEAAPYPPAAQMASHGASGGSPFPQAGAHFNANNGSPFSAPTSLFKIAPGESVQAQPLQSSPFSTPASSASNGSPLTVADVLPQLPPEVARFGGLSSDQPVAVSAQILDAALRSGQAALPIFEIYRVCPALFLSPISPQDPRMIPLPASKLPRLIASVSQPGNEGMNGGSFAQQAVAPAQPSGPSPFQVSPFSAVAPVSAPAPEPAPFIQLEPAPPQTTSLPARRNGPPPPLADIPGRDLSQLSLPGSAPANGSSPSAFPMSPFAASNLSAEPPAQRSEPQSSPFGSLPANPLPAVANLFAIKPEDSRADESPFGASSLTAAPNMGSPFGGAGGMMPPMAGPMPPQGSPFGSFSGPRAPGSGPLPSEPPSPFQNFGPAVPASDGSSLFGAGSASAPGRNGPAPAPQSAAPQNSPQALFSTGQPTPSGLAFPMTPPPANGGSSTFRVSLASLLRGYTVAELGFDPAIVPTWIMTTLPSASIRDQLASGQVITELGVLIDGITDVGFRNVLNNAKREFQLRLPEVELSQALAGGSPANTPSLSNIGSPPAPPNGLTMRIEPPAQGSLLPTPEAAASNPPLDPAPHPSQPQAMPMPASMFAAPAPQAATAPAVSPSHSLFTAPSRPATTHPPFGGLPPLSGQPAFGAPAAPLPMMPLQPSFGAAPTPAQSLFGGSPPPSTPLASFGSPQASSAQAAPSLFGGMAKPQDPFHAPSHAENGADLPPPFPSTPLPSWPQARAHSPQTDSPAAPQQPAAPPSPAPVSEPVQMSFPPPQTSPLQAFNGAPMAQPAAAPPLSDGFSSAQLLGGNNPPPSPGYTSFINPAEAPPPSYQPAPPANFHPQEPQREPMSAQPPPLPRTNFIPPVYEDRDGISESRQSPPPPRPEPAPTPASKRPEVPPMPSPKSNATSFLGLQPLDTKTDQILLRALLGTDEDLTPQRVVEMTSALGGIAACVCLKGDQTLSHAGAHKPQAREFQKQATDLAHHLRSLGPLIGIADAETFTLNAGDRLMTFCFPENTIMGVLHDAEPSIGLRDKITLIARELSRMLA